MIGLTLEPDKINYAMVIQEAENEYSGYNMVTALKCNLSRLQVIYRHKQNIAGCNRVITEIKIQKTKELINLFTTHLN